MAGRGLPQAAYYNLLAAAISTLPVLATGLLAWQFQTRGTEAPGTSLAARSSCMRLKPDDLTGVVAAFPRSLTDRISAELPSGL